MKQKNDLKKQSKANTGTESDNIKEDVKRESGQPTFKEALKTIASTPKKSK